MLIVKTAAKLRLFSPIIIYNNHSLIIFNTTCSFLFILTELLLYQLHKSRCCMWFESNRTGVPTSRRSDSLSLLHQTLFQTLCDSCLRSFLHR